MSRGCWGATTPLGFGLTASPKGGDVEQAPWMLQGIPSRKYSAVFIAGGDTACGAVAGTLRSPYCHWLDG